jgi:glycerol uptake facilitator-like aquaporin
MSLNLVTLLYLVASVCFIQALKGLSHPTTSIRGNLFGMIGMTIAVLTTAALIVKLSSGKAPGMLWVLVGLVAGGGYGAYRAKTVEMTKMPELVAFFHSMIGLAAVFIAEVLLTAVFVYVILGATDTRAPQGFAPIAIGLALTLIHLISIPISNTSVNPARSTGVAFFNGNGAVGQLWVFWLAPIIGAAIAGATFHLITGVDRRDRDISGEMDAVDLAVAEGVDPNAPR